VGDAAKIVSFVQGKIGREDIASLCVHLLKSEAACNTTFEIKSTIPFSQHWEGPPDGEDWGECGSPKPRDWEPELLAANLKRGVTGKTVNGVYTGKQVESEAAAGVQEQAVVL
jgi:hypothetical protein